MQAAALRVFKPYAGNRRTGFQRAARGTMSSRLPTSKKSFQPDNRQPEHCNADQCLHGSSSDPWPGPQQRPADGNRKASERLSGGTVVQESSHRHRFIVGFVWWGVGIHWPTRGGRQEPGHAQAGSTVTIDLIRSRKTKSGWRIWPTVSSSCPAPGSASSPFQQP